MGRVPTQNEARVKEREGREVETKRTEEGIGGVGKGTGRTESDGDNKEGSRRS